MMDSVQDNVTEEKAWDGPDYEAALAHLERLQEQINTLRSAIPSIVEPLGQPALNKAEMFKKLKGAAVRSTEDIKSFRSTWSSDQTQGLFSRSRESMEKDSDLGKALNVARYGWDQEGSGKTAS